MLLTVGPELLAETRRRLHAFVAARAPAGVDADDVVQDVLARLVERGGDVPPARVPAWALTTARHALVDELRRRRPLALEEQAVPAPAAEEEEAAADLARCLRPLLGLLDEADRALLEAIDAQDRSQAELARALGLSRSTVKSRVQRARQRLRAVVERCCALELDARGALIDARPRQRASCRAACD